MRRLFAIATLTWKAAFRFRLFWVLALLLLGSVVALPLLLKDDGTARGFTQILLTYNLSVITALLGLSTLWLACGTLAREVEDCQMQMVAVKPVARWQIWLGKWLGLLMLNAALLAVAGGSVYALLLWRAHRLPEDQQRVLRNEVFVARASLKPPQPDIEGAVERVFQQRIKEVPVPVDEQPLMREQLRMAVTNMYQLVPPGYPRDWTIHLGLKQALLRDQPLFLRVKFYAAQTNAVGSYFGTWQIGSPETKQVVFKDMNVGANSFSEFAIPNYCDEKGQLRIRFINRDQSTLLFPLQDGLEVLYREGSFGLNFTRGLGMILCWLALLAALGLAAASFLSFPVAAFFSLSLLLFGSSINTLATSASEGTLFGTDEGGVGGAPLVSRNNLIYKSAVSILQQYQSFDSIDPLSTGRSITWGQLGLAVLLVVMLLGGLISALGILIFNRRELATAQGSA